ncbi:toll/interleukin-1 receptor domain-containing protein [Shewanella algae]|uniref:toll/interleukin-1 receptor domain-containing protein n=1 Tax=Shewanella algae TaxID=38313 RepID=UPI001BED6555|nr:toll/interleukin-1 receptor domain-containing protein [Shewanella algae]BCV54222.1 hypothetical protein TUM17383_24690 [Shewanella algae]
MEKKKKVKFFVSYAHRNSDLATEFIEHLRDVLKPSKSYCYEYWQDNQLTVGEKWDNQIQEAVESCDLGLLLISPSFFCHRIILLKMNYQLSSTESLVFQLC